MTPDLYLPPAPSVGGAFQPEEHLFLGSRGISFTSTVEKMSRFLAIRENHVFSQGLKDEHAAWLKTTWAAMGSRSEGHTVAGSSTESMRCSGA